MKQPAWSYQSCSYTAAVLRYAITDSKRFGNNLTARRSALMEHAKRLVQAGIDYIQLREKDLEAGDLLMLAEDIMRVLSTDGDTRLLINSRADVAVAAGAGGVHLTSHLDELTPVQVRQVFAVAESWVEPIISVSCHTPADVERACANAADLILFGPTFEKKLRDELVVEGVGLGALHEACELAGNIPVVALGGITAANTRSCMDCGAAGIAGIRLFP